MDNLRGLLGIRRMYRVPNARMREMCGMTKGVNERFDEVWPSGEGRKSGSLREYMQ